MARRRLSIDARVVFLPQTGRFRLGISCVATAFMIVRVGPDSALCLSRGKCTEDQLSALTQADFDFVRTYFPAQVPFTHVCGKHGFGWYDAVNVPAGPYLAMAASGSRFFGLVDGHGTMDTYAFIGNNGDYQPVNCVRDRWSAVTRSAAPAPAKAATAAKAIAAPVPSAATAGARAGRIARAALTIAETAAPADYTTTANSRFQSTAISCLRVIGVRPQRIRTLDPVTQSPCVKGPPL